jgi:hypothetical protein
MLSPRLELGQHRQQVVDGHVAELWPLQGHTSLGEDAALASNVARSVDVVACSEMSAHRSSSGSSTRAL